MISSARSSHRKSRKVTLVDRNDVTLLCNVVNDLAIIVGEWRGPINYHDQEIRISSFALCLIDAERFDLII